MKKYFDVLRKCPLFDGINNEDLTLMLGCLGAKVIKSAKREIIIAEGSPAEYICIVLSGSVQLERIDYDGNRSIVTSIAPSELFAESYACAMSAKMPMDAIAAADSEIMLLECRKVLTPCNNSCSFHNKMIFNLLKIVATKNIALNQKAEITNKRTTKEKLMTYLLSQAKKCGKNSFTIPFDRQELADFLVVDRSGLSAEISKLRKEGVIESRKSWFRICDKFKL